MKVQSPTKATPLQTQLNELSENTKQSVKIATHIPLQITAMMMDNYSQCLNALCRYQSPTDKTIQQQKAVIIELQTTTDSLLNEQEALNKSLKQTKDKVHTQTQTIKKHNTTIKKMQLDEQADKEQAEQNLQTLIDAHQVALDNLKKDFEYLLAERESQLTETQNQYQQSQKTIDELNQKLIENTQKLDNVLNQQVNEHHQH